MIGGDWVIAVLVFEDLEAFGRDAQVADFDLGPEGDDVDDLEGELASIEMVAVDVVGNVRDVKRAEVGNLGKSLKEEMLNF